jgi:methylated-DNA-[protein]-cysteine S-methyltransferase
MPTTLTRTVIHTVVDSPVGPLTLTSDGAALTALYLPEDRRPPAPEALGEREPDAPVFVAAREQLGAYFAGRQTDFELPLRATGTDFQHRVWDELRRIGYGETITYTELAERVGKPTAARAVGAANGRNPLAIIVPCHRVIGASGQLTGYAGGLECKRYLLELEQGATVLV